MTRTLTPAERKARKVRGYRGAAWFYASREGIDIVHEVDGRAHTVIIPTWQMKAALAAVERERGKERRP